MSPLVKDTRVRFQRAIELLRNPDAVLNAEAIHSLSDLDGDSLDTFLALWPQMSIERRRSLITRLVETAEINFELDFSTIIHPALTDPDPEVRVAAIEGVLEDSPRRVIEQLMQLAQNDPFSEVRAAAAQALGQFVLKGELGKLPDAFNTHLQDTILAIYHNRSEDLDVRRRALEAIGNCSREGVTELILDAYNADELMMRASAVFAMGRTCDGIWQGQIMQELSSEHPEMRYEAARAAGELELRPALPRLAELAYDDDRQIQEVSIWAMGEIGGRAANKVLTELATMAESTDDNVLMEAVEEAIAASSLSGTDHLALFDYSEYDDEYMDEELKHLLDDDEIDDLYDLNDDDDDDEADEDDEDDEDDDGIGSGDGDDDDDDEDDDDYMDDDDDL